MARPRSVRAHNQVLEAAIKLFAERGIDSTSIDSIAEASGVSKATIYKHWTDKEALCLEALVRMHALDERLTHNSGDPRLDIIAVLGRGSPEQKTELQNRLMPHLISYAARNPEFGRAWRARVFEPPKTRIKELLKQAMEQGVFPADLNLNIAVAMLMGPIMYRRLVQTKLPEDMATQVVDAFWRAHALWDKGHSTVSSGVSPQDHRSSLRAGSSSATTLGSRSPRGG